jgi:CheY-like chemotaxis protein
MLQMAGFTLKSADHVVRVAGDGEPALKACQAEHLGSGEEALTVAKGRRVHLVVTDINMPGMS